MMTREKLSNGLKAHHFVRMTPKDRFSDELNYECMCGAEFESDAQLCEHQDLHLRIYLGIRERPAEKKL